MARASWQARQGLTGKEEPIGKQCAQEDQEDKAAQEGKENESLSSCVHRGGHLCDIFGPCMRQCRCHLWVIFGSFCGNP